MASVLITGGTGLIGKALTESLVSKGYEVFIVTRNAAKEKREKRNVSYTEWNIQKQTIDEKAIQSADYIIHLAGANVADKRWTTERKKEILQSRTQSSALLVKTLKEIPNEVKAVISASAIGWYGPDRLTPRPSVHGEENSKFLETDPAYNDFLGTTTKAWEESIKPLIELNKRIAILRTGIVLSNEGGAYKEFKKLLKFGIASVLGNGKQMVSWIHIDDLVRLYINAIENANISGVYNAVAPHPVSNKELIHAIAKMQRISIPISVPSFVLKTVLGEMSIEVLKSATVSSKKIESTGFQFQFPTIDDAVNDLK